MLELNDDKISFVYKMKRARAHLGLGFKLWNSLADLWPCEASLFGGLAAMRYNRFAEAK